MAQVKKATVRNAILKNARSLFIAQEYVGTSMAQIASRANISTANLYIYFNSKYDIFYTVYEEWLTKYINKLELKVRAVDDQHKRVEIILTALWIDIPKKNKGFSNNLLQALSTKSPRERYSSRLLLVSEARIYDLLRECLPKETRLYAKDLLPRLLFMAMDGFILNHHLNSISGDVDQIVRLVCDLLVPEE